MVQKVVLQLLERVRGVLQRPRQVLPLTLAESGAARAVLIPYVAVLAALGPMALFLCDGVLGAWHGPTEIFNTVIPGGWARTSLGPALAEMLAVYAIAVGGWLGLAATLAFVARWFGGMGDHASARKAAAYTLTPVWIGAAAQVFGSVPYLSWLPGVALVAGLAWAAFIGVVALPLHLGTPDRQAPAHVLTALTVTAIAAAVSYLLASSAINAIASFSGA